MSYQIREVCERLTQWRGADISNSGCLDHGSLGFGQLTVNDNLVDVPVEHQPIKLVYRHHNFDKPLQKITDWMNKNGYIYNLRKS